MTVHAHQRQSLGAVTGDRRAFEIGGKASRLRLLGGKPHLPELAHFQAGVFVVCIKLEQMIVGAGEKQIVGRDAGGSPNPLGVERNPAK